MTACRVCGGDLPVPAYDAPAPALTSIMTLLDVPSRVFVCDRCGHAQSDDIPDIRAFYDSTYRISLAGEGHDQVFAVRADGTVIFRTDHQAEIALGLLGLPPNALVLDYGAAKADTLRKMVAARPDLQPHVFDVSADYAGAWDGWVAREAQAIYTVPAAWTGRFDAAMSHFVLEHVPDPVGFIRDLGALIKPDGVLLLSLPDAAANPGDMMVADHLNHFSAASLAFALSAGGFRLRALDRTSFPGAFFVVCERTSEARRMATATPDAAEAADGAREICQSWERAAGVLEAEAERFRGRKAAIYGAGFYGSWILSRVGRSVSLVSVLDRNPHLEGTTHFEIPVIRPERIGCEVEVLFIGLNPLKARDAIAAQPWLNRAGLAHVWL